MHSSFRETLDRFLEGTVRASATLIRHIEQKNVVKRHLENLFKINNITIHKKGRCGDGILLQESFAFQTARFHYETFERLSHSLWTNREQLFEMLDSSGPGIELLSLFESTLGSASPENLKPVLAALWALKRHLTAMEDEEPTTASASIEQNVVCPVCQSSFVPPTCEDTHLNSIRCVFCGTVCPVATPPPLAVNIGISCGTCGQRVPICRALPSLQNRLYSEADCGGWRGLLLAQPAHDAVDCANFQLFCSERCRDGAPAAARAVPLAAAWLAASHASSVVNGMLKDCLAVLLDIGTNRERVEVVNMFRCCGSCATLLPALRVACLPTAIESGLSHLFEVAVAILTPVPQSQVHECPSVSNTAMILGAEPVALALEPGDFAALWGAISWEKYGALIAQQSESRETLPKVQQFVGTICRLGLVSDRLGLGASVAKACVELVQHLPTGAVDGVYLHLCHWLICSPVGVSKELCGLSFRKLSPLGFWAVLWQILVDTAFGNTVEGWDVAGRKLQQVSGQWGGDPDTLWLSSQVTRVLSQVSMSAPAPAIPATTPCSADARLLLSDDRSVCSCSHPAGCYRSHIRGWNRILATPLVDAAREGDGSPPPDGDTSLRFSGDLFLGDSIRSNFVMNVSEPVVRLLAPLALASPPGGCVAIVIELVHVLEGNPRVYDAAVRSLQEIAAERSSCISTIVRLMHCSYQRLAAVTLKKLLEALPWKSWTPTASDLEILGSWLCESANTESHHWLARHIIDALLHDISLCNSSLWALASVLALSSQYRVDEEEDGWLWERLLLIPLEALSPPMLHHRAITQGPLRRSLHTSAEPLACLPSHPLPCTLEDRRQSTLCPCCGSLAMTCYSIRDWMAVDSAEAQRFNPAVGFVFSLHTVHALRLYTRQPESIVEALDNGFLAPLARIVQNELFAPAAALFSAFAAQFSNDEEFAPILFRGLGLLALDRPVPRKSELASWMGAYVEERGVAGKESTLCSMLGDCVFETILLLWQRGASVAPAIKFWWTVFSELAALHSSASLALDAVVNAAITVRLLDPSDGSLLLCEYPKHVQTAEFMALFCATVRESPLRQKIQKILLGRQSWEAVEGEVEGVVFCVQLWFDACMARRISDPLLPLFFQCFFALRFASLDGVCVGKFFPVKKMESMAERLHSIAGVFRGIAREFAAVESVEEPPPEEGLLHQHCRRQKVRVVSVCTAKAELFHAMELWCGQKEPDSPLLRDISSGLFLSKQEDVSRLWWPYVDGYHLLLVAVGSAPSRPGPAIESEASPLLIEEKEEEEEEEELAALSVRPIRDDLIVVKPEMGLFLEEVNRVSKTISLEKVEKSQLSVVNHVKLWLGTIVSVSEQFQQTMRSLLALDMQLEQHAPFLWSSHPRTKTFAAACDKSGQCKRRFRAQMHVEPWQFEPLRWLLVRQTRFQYSATLEEWFGCSVLPLAPQQWEITLWLAKWNLGMHVALIADATGQRDLSTAGNAVLQNCALQIFKMLLQADSSATRSYPPAQLLLTGLLRRIGGCLVRNNPRIPPMLLRHISAQNGRSAVALAPLLFPGFVESADFLVLLQLLGPSMLRQDPERLWSPVAVQAIFSRFNWQQWLLKSESIPIVCLQIAVRFVLKLLSTVHPLETWTPAPSLANCDYEASLRLEEQLQWKKVVGRGCGVLRTLVGHAFAVHFVDAIPALFCRLLPSVLSSDAIFGVSADCLDPSIALSALELDKPFSVVEPMHNSAWRALLAIPETVWHRISPDDLYHVISTIHSLLTRIRDLRSVEYSPILNWSESIRPKLSPERKQELQQQLCWLNEKRKQYDAQDNIPTPSLPTWEPPLAVSVNTGLLFWHRSNLVEEVCRLFSRLLSLPAILQLRTGGISAAPDLPPEHLYRWIALEQLYLPLLLDSEGTPSWSARDGPDVERAGRALAESLCTEIELFFRDSGEHCAVLRCAWEFVQYVSSRLSVNVLRVVLESFASLPWEHLVLVYDEAHEDLAILQSVASSSPIASPMFEFVIHVFPRLNWSGICEGVSPPRRDSFLFAMLDSSVSLLLRDQSSMAAGGGMEMGEGGEGLEEFIASDTGFRHLPWSKLQHKSYRSLLGNASLLLNQHRTDKDWRIRQLLALEMLHVVVSFAPAAEMTKEGDETDLKESIFKLQDFLQILRTPLVYAVEKQELFPFPTPVFARFLLVTLGEARKYGVLLKQRIGEHSLVVLLEEIARFGDVGDELHFPPNQDRGEGPSSVPTASQSEEEEEACVTGEGMYSAPTFAPPLQETSLIWMSLQFRDTLKLVSSSKWLSKAGGMLQSVLGRKQEPSEARLVVQLLADTVSAVLWDFWSNSPTIAAWNLHACSTMLHNPQSFAICVEQCCISHLEAGGAWSDLLQNLQWPCESPLYQQCIAEALKACCCLSLSVLSRKMIQAGESLLTVVKSLTGWIEAVVPSSPLLLLLVAELVDATISAHRSGASPRVLVSSLKTTSDHLVALSQSKVSRAGVWGLLGFSEDSSLALEHRVLFGLLGFFLRKQIEANKLQMVGVSSPRPACPELEALVASVGSTAAGGAALAGKEFVCDSSNALPDFSQLLQNGATLLGQHALLKMLSR